LATVKKTAVSKVYLFLAGVGNLFTITGRMNYAELSQAGRKIN